jgi:hypothetical protein
MAEHNNATVNTSRKAVINYIGVHGDTFTPPSVSFYVDEDPEDFTGATLKMQVVNEKGKVLKELTDTEGITVTDNSLTYSISATDTEELFRCGLYYYDVQKTTGDIVETIQGGQLSFIKDITL